MSKMKWLTGALTIAATTLGAVCGKLVIENNKLKGENDLLKDQLEQVLKKAMQQSYHNGRNAERAANIEEK